MYAWIEVSADMLMDGNPQGWIHGLERDEEMIDVCNE